MVPIKLSFTLLCIVICWSTSNSLKLTSEELESYWKHYKTKHGKNYRALVDDYFRKYTFGMNLQRILEHNTKADLGLSRYRLALNRYADQMPEEIVNKRLGLKNSQQLPNELQFYEPDVKKASTIEATVDWRRKGLVNPPLDQGECGACWAFAAATSIEAAWGLRTNNLVNASVQQMIDCSWGTGNEGCLGGNMIGAYLYLLSNQFVDGNDYPYQEGDYLCRADKVKRKYGKLSAIGFVDPGNEEDLKLAVNEIGPISLAIDASSPYLIFYWSGVYDDDICTTDVNHAVTVVGYGTDDYGDDYWIVKNSWGTEWGESGYVRMKRGVNLCGIAEMPSYPILK